MNVFECADENFLKCPAGGRESRDTDLKSLAKS